ncbi:MAG: bifunctional glutamate N-acetyltransferase/amino-acid acetyltransferase ArgJ [Candidatus Omnitrophica bacterium]|nr:bifunctional glutamate N-acetyltransferase/amino-acid acetyltransferase ArgJ [Candidatus Omnitrophota bacterium]
MKVINKKGAITVPRGFKAAGVHCGIKGKRTLDVALIFSEKKARAAAVFTTNKVKAWPVLIGQKHLLAPFHRAIIVNSGNANCSNGVKNKEKVKKICQLLARLLNIKGYEIFPSSTGVIGRDFPHKKVTSCIPLLIKKLSRTKGHEAAQAILTTDTKTKEATVSFSIGGKTATLSVMAKGAGMLHPNMATMLIFMTTDVNISKQLLKEALKIVTTRTFNMINVDNDMSTNDTLLILANGAAGNICIKKKGKDFFHFLKALGMISYYIAKEIVRDGEGVTKVCEIHIQGAHNTDQAKQAARALADSMLFKTALHGADPNWGRIVAALGAQKKLKCDFTGLTIMVGRYPVLKKGKPYSHNLKNARAELKKKEVHFTIDLACGKAYADCITSDLTKKYIEINAKYTT